MVATCYLQRTYCQIIGKGGMGKLTFLVNFSLNSVVFLGDMAMVDCYYWQTYNQKMTTPDSFTNFGELLKYLRRRVRLTQYQLAMAVGYTEAHLCRLEKNQRLPDPAVIAALFVPALELDESFVWVERLLELAKEAHSSRSVMPTKAGDLPRSNLLETIPPLPHQLIDRPDLLARLRTYLALNRGVALCGLAGLGKTTLATMLARDVGRTRPLFWLTIASDITTSVEAIIHRLALFLLELNNPQLRLLLPSARYGSRPEIALDQQISLLASALAGQSALLCFDDFHLVDHQPAVLALFRRLVSSTEADFLFISRRNVPLPGLPQVTMTGLEANEGAVLVQHLSPLLGDHAYALWDKTGGSPMLLRLALAQLPKSRADPTWFITHLETNPQVAAYLLETTLKELPAPAGQLATFLAVFRHPINLYDERLIELAEIEGWAEAIIGLQQSYLVHHPAYASLHPLIQDHLYTTLNAKPVLKRRYHRLAALWSRSHDILEAAYHHSRAGQLSQAIDLLTHHTTDIYNQGQVMAALLVADEIKGRLATRPESTPNLRCRLFLLRGNLLSQTGRIQEAIADYHQALAETSRPEEKIAITYQLGLSHMRRSQYPEILTLCQQASPLAPPNSQAKAKLDILTSIALRAIGRFDEADEIAGRILTTLAHLPPSADLAEMKIRIYRLRSDLRRTHNQFEESLAETRHALAVADEAGFDWLKQICQQDLAYTWRAQGKLEMARQQFHQVTDWMRTSGDLYTMAYGLIPLADIYYRYRQYDTALEWLAESCQLLKWIGDRKGLASAERQRATVLMAQGQIANAQQIIRRVVEELEGAEPTRLIGYYQERLAMTHLLQGDTATATQILQAALQLPMVTYDLGLQEWLRADLALAYLLDEELERAMEALHQIKGESVYWRLVDGWLALADGREIYTGRVAHSLAQRSQQEGDQFNLLRSGRLDQARRHPPPLAAIPHLLWVDGER